MKKIVLAALLLTEIMATTQEREMKDVTPEQMATLQTKKMTLAIYLNETQQTKMKALFTANTEKRKAKMEEHKARKESGEKPT
jgi:hypothetical protein